MSVKRMKSVGVIGLMSGTSLDGLDICYANFKLNEGMWSVDGLITSEIAYDKEWRERLGNAISLDEKQRKELSENYGRFLGEQVEFFMQAYKIKGETDLIASHGHTVFHQPENGITVQIGDGDQIVAITNKLVVCDFRSNDVSLGGQGAPLVPVGDQLLFGEYEACLNLGGIANISFNQNGERIAFDISPCNLPFNKIMREWQQKEYDKDGQLARSGEIDKILLEQLNELNYYREKSPKSLGIEWLNESFYPVFELNPNNIPVEGLLRTILEHETEQIAAVINASGKSNVLVTGGGAFNVFFIERLKEKCQSEIILPSPEIISFKEALIFAFLGLLNMRDEINTYKSVTGASKDSIGGVRIYPNAQ